MTDRTCDYGRTAAPRRLQCNMCIKLSNLSRNPPCDFPDCANRSLRRAGGLCGSHTRQRDQGKELRPLMRRNHDVTCSVDGCEGAFYAHDLCRTHYARSKGVAPKPVRKTCIGPTVTGEPCGRPAQAHQLCRAHCAQRSRGSDLSPIRSERVRSERTPKPKPEPRPCLECDRIAVRRGYCDTHYRQLRRSGTLKQIRKPGTKSSVLPPGWDKPMKKREYASTPGTGGVAELPPSYVFVIPDEVQAAAWERIAGQPDAAELAAMLGLVAA